MFLFLLGFTYAGTQYGLECFCGNSQPSAAQALQSSECNLPCPGNNFVANIFYLAFYKIYELIKQVRLG